MEELQLNELTRSDRNKWSWTQRNLNRAEDIKNVMYELQDWWPMTIRQVFYRLISSNLTDQEHWYWKGKKVDIYSALKRTMKWMRIDDRLPWNAITDEHRTTTEKLGFTDIRQFLNQELNYFLEGYRRCSAQKQDNYIEVWIEKAALLHIVKPIADEFCRRVVCCRGYNSITFQTEFYDRASQAINRGEQPRVLYFGDWDPSGVNMIYAAMQTLTDELYLYEVKYHRAGINPEQFGLIHADPVPLKPEDTRTKSFVDHHGETAYELDAFHPEQLQQIVRESIEALTDMSKVEDNEIKGEDDSIKIAELKNDVYEYVDNRASELGIYL
jgi:hypothetical protein